ncbi:MAG: peptidoglycan editing factor PgeF [Sporomusaceae bacterium]|nr:peptidoglycan editing factor PgeF [Sporomusaceae bacterium]
MSKFVIKRAANGVWHGLFTHLAHQGVRHGVSTRLGGLSVPPYATLNLGLKSGDDPGKVLLNRDLFCQAVGVDYARAVTCQQIHGDHIHLVTDEDAGRGTRSHAAAVPASDALITDRRGIPLILFYADCVPVLIFDPARRAIGLSHAGWKGTVAKIAAKTVLAMGEHYGTSPADCFVGIGPSIGPCCYEVDAPVVEELQASFAGTWRDLVVPSGDKWHLDLWHANRDQLEEIGVPRAHIDISGVCTAENTTLFYSHRAERGTTGRHGAVICL